MYEYAYDIWEVKNGFAFSDFCACVQTHLKTVGLLLSTLRNPFSWGLLALEMYMQTVIQNSHPSLYLLT